MMVSIDVDDVFVKKRTSCYAHSIQTTPAFRSSSRAWEISLNRDSYASGQSWNLTRPSPNEVREYAPKETRSHQGSTGSISSASFVGKRGVGII